VLTLYARNVKIRTDVCSQFLDAFIVANNFLTCDELLESDVWLLFIWQFIQTVHQPVFVPQGENNIVQMSERSTY
jgi:hypothetical protein